ncbi:hypothetical protein JXL21_02215 [Candidatus Bathyarchaeota archaeon]|nr:hypothetical protein [Candidatus Bathyarchaeota archaeon]
MASEDKEKIISLIAGSVPTDRINGLRALQRNLSSTPLFLSNEEIDSVFYFMVNYSPSTNTDAILYVKIARLLHKVGRLTAIPFQRLLNSENITALYLISEISDLIDSCLHENLVLKAKEILLKYEPDKKQYKYSLNILRKLDSKFVMHHLKEELKRLDGTIIGPLEILREVADASISDYFLEILTNVSISIDYVGKVNEVLILVWNYFSKYPEEIAFTEVNNIINFFYYNKNFNEHLIEFLKSKGKSDVNQLFQIIEEFEENENVIGNILKVMSLFEEELLFLDFERLLRLTYKPPKYFVSIWWLKEIASKVDVKYEPILEKLYFGSNSEYEFAKDVFVSRGKDLNDLRRTNPVISLFNYFCDTLIDNPKKKITYEQLIEDDSEHRNRVKKPDRFEMSILNLFASMGFITLWLDMFGIEGYDILAYSSKYDRAFVIGCTTGAIKQNDITVSYYTSKAEKSIEITEITPVICTNCSWDEAIRTKEAAEDGILVLTKEEIKKLKELAQDSRSHNEARELIDKMILNQKSVFGNNMVRYPY